MSYFSCLLLTITGDKPSIIFIQNIKSSKLLEESIKKCDSVFPIKITKFITSSDESVKKLAKLMNCVYKCYSYDIIEKRILNINKIIDIANNNNTHINEFIDSVNGLCYKALFKDLFYGENLDLILHRIEKDERFNLSDYDN